MTSKQSRHWNRWRIGLGGGGQNVTDKAVELSLLT